MNKMVNGELVALTQAEVTQRETDIAASEAEQLATGYISQRQSEYPPIEDYLDGIVKGDQAQVNQYIADCQAVKTKYPKPTL
jgi:hypothetical protein|tara:strand:- start:1369 stop:1614 length:246 start_codon:yes stop_codon:yes gene_type:complete